MLRILFELCPYGIWNVDFIEKKLTGEDLNFVPMGFETYADSDRFNRRWIWTLSLWDLKQLYFPYITFGDSFELCPYGIWN